MEKINIATFKKWLNANDMRLIIDSGEKLARISKNINLVATENENGAKYEQRVTGYNFLCDGSSVFCSDIAKVVEVAEKNGFIADGYVCVKFINETFETYQDFLDDKNFQSASMQEILQKTEGADSFALISDFDNCISIETAQAILEKTIGETISRCKFIYESLTVEEKKNLPPFNSLLEKIFIEWASVFTSNDSKKDYEKFKSLTLSAHSDLVLSEFYDQFNVLSECKIFLDEAVNSDKSKTLDSEFDLPENLPLKNALIDLELTFSSHSCVTNKLLKVFRFNLNEDTKKWLLSFKNDYEIVGFYDLAFYKGEKLLFSSRSQERQHILFKD